MDVMIPLLPNRFTDREKALHSLRMMFFTLSSWKTFGLWLIYFVAEIQAQSPAWWNQSSTTATYKPNPNAKLTTSYFFPYACSVVYLDNQFKKGHTKTATWVSSCTILTPRWVAASTDAFNFLSPDSSYFFYQDVSKLQVNAGTIYGTPSPTAKGLRNLQQLQVDTFVTLTDGGFLDGDKTEVFKISGPPTRKMNMNRALEKNNMMTFRWDVAFLRLQAAFKWSPQVLPAPQNVDNVDKLKKQVKNFVSHLERVDGSQNCVVAGWNRISHRLGFYRVRYIPIDLCMSTYCKFDTRACMNFPDPELHACFQSIDYGYDACPEDRGSALFCDGFGHSVVGILTTAPNCGMKNLPGVYTLIDRVVFAFVKSGAEETITKLPDADIDRYTLPPKEFA